MGLLVEFERALVVQLPIMVIASFVGAWIFPVQHRLGTALWQGQAPWSAGAASLKGSSCLRLPPVLQ